MIKNKINKTTFLKMPETKYYKLFDDIKSRNFENKF